MTAEEKRKELEQIVYNLNVIESQRYVIDKNDSESVKSELKSLRNIFSILQQIQKNLNDNHYDIEKIINNLVEETKN